jgi:hypothetical protein
MLSFGALETQQSIVSEKGKSFSLIQLDLDRIIKL